jgi:RNA exonuclease 1
MYAVDCEMVDSSEGHDVASVSLIDSSGAILLHEYVLPQAPVHNWLTQWSGMKESVSYQFLYLYLNDCVKK